MNNKAGTVPDTGTMIPKIHQGNPTIHKPSMIQDKYS